MRDHEYAHKSGFMEVLNKMYYGVMLCVIAGLLFAQQNGAVRSIAGLSIFNVLTSSMESEIPKGSMVITKSIDEGELYIGDDITFLVGPTTTITHRIVGIIENYNDTGYRGFETKGIENANKDKDVIVSPNIVGKVIYHNYYMGKVLEFIKAYWVQIVIYLVLFINIRNLLVYLFNKRNTPEEEETTPIDDPPT